MAQKDNFIFHEKYLQYMDELSDSEFRQVICAMAAYSCDGTEPEFEDRAVRILWKTIRDRLRSDAEAYEARCNANRANGKKGGRQKNPSVSGETQKIQENPSVFQETQKNPSVSEETQKTQRFSEKPKKPDIDTDIDIDIDIKKESIEKKPQAATLAKRKYGEYGWVRLTDAEYNRLISDLGKPEVDRCVRYVDESAQQTGNKNKWKDWNLVVRKCSRDQWGVSHSGGKPNAFQNFRQHDHNFDELEGQLDRQFFEGAV